MPLKLIPMDQLCKAHSKKRIVKRLPTIFTFTIVYKVHFNKSYLSNYHTYVVDIPDIELLG